MCLTVQEVRDHAFRETCSFDVAYLLDHPRVTVVEGSITDLDLLMETFPGADGIFHQAANRPGR